MLNIRKDELPFDYNAFNKSEEEVYNEMLDKLKELNIYDKDLVPVSNDS